MSTFHIYLDIYIYIAVNTLANFFAVKAITTNILLASAIWDWGKNERQKLPSNHSYKTKLLLQGSLFDLRRLITLPTFTRGRHQFTEYGKNEAQEYMDIFHAIARRISFTIKQLHMQVEVMKTAGLPANEASRINQYHWFLQARIEKLCNIKVRFIYIFFFLFATILALTLLLM